MLVYKTFRFIFFTQKYFKAGLCNYVGGACVGGFDGGGSGGRYDNDADATTVDDTADNDEYDNNNNDNNDNNDNNIFASPFIVIFSLFLVVIFD